MSTTVNMTLVKFSGGSRVFCGGCGPHGGGAWDSLSGYTSQILYVEIKESGPLGGHVPGTLPGSASEILHPGELC